MTMQYMELTDWQNCPKGKPNLSEARFVENHHRNTSSVGEMVAYLEWPMLEKRRLNTRVCLLKKIVGEKVFIKCDYLEPAAVRARLDSLCNQQVEELSKYRKMSFFPCTI